MKKLCLQFSLVLFFFELLFAQTDYQRLHKEALVVDMHADVLLRVLRGVDISKRTETGQVDLVRLKEGGVDVQFFAVWSDPRKYMPDKMYEHSLYMIEILNKIIDENPQTLTLARSVAEIESTVVQGKIATCIGVEGGTAIENDLQKLEKLYQLGVRYLSLTWNDSPDWASCAKDETTPGYEGHRGLTDFGKDVIKKMNALGMMVDVSHSGEQTFRDVISTSNKPVIASHSCVAALCPHYRNLTDDQIRALAKNGGVIFINFYPGYLQKGFDSKYEMIRENSKAHLDSVRLKYENNPLQFFTYQREYMEKQISSFLPSIQRVVDHMEYIINLAGDDFVGIGSDYDGISIAPAGLEDVSYLPELTKAMRLRGFSDERIRKILGGNFKRVFTSVTDL